MAYADYIHCSSCDCKLIYDGYDDTHEDFVASYGTDYKILCPDCIKKAKEKYAAEREMVEWLVSYQSCRFVADEDSGLTVGAEYFEWFDGEKFNYIEIIDGDIRAAILKAMEVEVI